MTNGGSNSQSNLVIQKIIRVKPDIAQVIGQRNGYHSLYNIEKQNDGTRLHTQHTKCIGSPGISASVIANILPVENLSHPNGKWNGADEVSENKGYDDLRIQCE